jgi:GT2 family glycosyltransferase
LSDADAVVDPSWLGELVRASADHHLVGGRLDVDELNSAEVRSWRPTPSTATAIAPEFVPSGNMAIWADCYAGLGGFDVDFLKSHDVELSQRAIEAGASIGFAPDAVVQYRLRATLAGLARQSYRGGRATVRMAARHPDRQQRVRLVEMGRLGWWLLVRLPYLVSGARRGTWIRRAAQLAGIVVTSARLRLGVGRERHP